jgi:hypothetical protein
MRHFIDKLNLDAIGFSASTLCAIHCLALPFAASILPLIGLEFLEHPAFEFSIIGLGVVVGVTSLWHGYSKHHHNPIPVGLLVAGFSLITLGHTIFEDYEFIFTSLGASLIAIAHLINIRLLKHENAFTH